MNPLSAVLILAPAAVLGALLFVWVYEDQSSSQEVERARHQVERLEFERDFTRAWNGEALEEPEAAEIEAARGDLEAKEHARQAARQASCEQLAAFAEDLDPRQDGAATADCEQASGG